MAHYFVGSFKIIGMCRYSLRYSGVALRMRKYIVTTIRYRLIRFVMLLLRAELHGQVGEVRHRGFQLDGRHDPSLGR